MRSKRSRLRRLREQLSVVDRFIAWATRDEFCKRDIVTFDGKFLFNRFEFLRVDESDDHSWRRDKEHYAKRAGGSKYQDRRPNQLPWWLPLNAFLHHWHPEPGSQEGFHDHPCWSITICLKGQLIERTPWKEQHLRPGSVVFRSHKFIHAFRLPDGVSEAWTLFIVGRRKHSQNTYIVTSRAV